MLTSNFSRVLCCISLFLLAVPGWALTDYGMEATATYGFAFNGTSPDALNSEQMEDILRLTEIFYRQVYASKFPQSYQNVLLAYKSHDWQKANDVLVFNFDAKITFREFESVPVPSQALAMDAMIVVNTQAYIDGYVKLADPADLFFWADSVTVIAKATTAPPSNAVAPTQSSPLNDFMFPQEDAPPTESSPLNDLMFPQQEQESPSEAVGSGGLPLDEQQVSVATTTSTSQNGDEHIKIDMPEEMGDAFGTPFEPVSSLGGGQGSNHAASENQHSAALVATTTDFELTASNLFYWMAAIRIMYVLVQMALSKWSRTYKASDKKIHLASYWVQLATQLPTLAVLFWVVFAIRGNDSDCVATGLQVFSHAAMALLSVWGMELFLRGQEMNKVLVAHRVVFIAAMLYVIEVDSSTMRAPVDLITFGTIEALGASIELPAQVLMIHYRFWSDSPTEVQGRLRPRVSLVFQLCLSMVFFAKVGFLAVSVLWYVLKLDDLTGSNLIWVVPLIRIVQAPFLVRTFHLQLLLYSKVATANPSEDAPTKEIVVEFSTDEDRNRQEQDV